MWCVSFVRSCFPRSLLLGALLLPIVLLLNAGVLVAEARADAYVSGRVVDTNGDPVVGALADAFKWDGVEWRGAGAVPTDSLGSYTNGPLADGTYIVTAHTEDLAGNLSGSSAFLAGDLVIDTTAPNVPYLDLISADDKGFSDTDNFTQEQDLHVTVTVSDTRDGDGNPVPNDIQYRIYDRPGDAGTNGEVLLVDSMVTQGGLSTNGFFEELLPTLDFGVHNLKLVAEDRAGNTSEFLLQVTIDPDACDTSVLKLANGQVLLYDLDAVFEEGSDGFEIVTDVDAGDFVIICDKAGNVRRVELRGDATGMGIIVNPKDGGPVDFVDKRTIPEGDRTENLEFLVLNVSSSKNVVVRSGINGADLTDIAKCESYLLPGPDIDGDGTPDLGDLAFYTTGPVTKKAHFGGPGYPVGGDVVFGGPVAAKVAFKAGIGVGSRLGFLDDLTGSVSCTGTFGGDAYIWGDFVGRMGDKSTANGPATLFVDDLINGFVYRQPDGLLPVIGPVPGFGGAFLNIAAI